MNQLELFRATVAHEPHEEFLFYMKFTPDLERRVREARGVDGEADLRREFGMFNPEMVSLTPPDEAPEPDCGAYYGDLDVPEDAWIDYYGVLHVPGQFYHFRRRISPLRNARSFEEIENYPYPTLEGYSEEGMAEAVQRAHAEGRAACGRAGLMYEPAWQIRGYEQFLEDMMLRPEWCEYILDRLMEHNRQIACAAARAGVDFLHTGDDVANQVTLMFSPDQWRRFIKCRWAEVYRAARRIKPDIEVRYHSDGNVEQIIPELMEIGVTILNPVQPECLDPEMVNRRWGERLGMDGTVGTQSTMPWGSADEVREVIRRRKRTVGRDGALILSPTHVLEPEVPLENIEAFAEEARRTG